MRRSILMLLALGTVASLAYASPNVHADTLVGFGHINLASTTFEGELGTEFERQPLVWQLGGGMRYRDLALFVSGHIGFLNVHDQERHGYSSMTRGVSAELRYYMVPREGFQPYIRLGLGRTWIDGTGPVTRYCAESSTCTGGFFPAEPDYAGNTLRVGVGLQYTPATRSSFYTAFWLDAGYEAVSGMEVVERDLRGGLIGLTLGAAIGGGRTR